MNPLYKQDQRTVLVVGGSGKTGRRVAERLRAAGRPVRIGSRAARPSFDWEDPSTWAGALQGVSAAYITYYPDLAMPGAPQAIEAFARQALQAGVRRLVLLSGRGEHEAQQAEEKLMATGADWTIVRCSWFMQNFDEGAFLDSILSGEVALPVSDMPEPFVDADDIADVAVAALSDDRHIGQLYELTGPRMLSFAEAVGEIARASGREIAFAQIPMDAFAAGATQQGMPAEIVEFLGYLFTEVLDGRNAYLGDGVQRALGREPRDFAEYARRAAAAGAWK
ncbi:NmrA family transcriptional regulator [Luteimonas gilva]|uniref:NmrA family transcriptional regulator n=1 Tax=Luteimonas gilva TaxID=2572684 RepID=A0A4U5K2C3_9GAMM|nr:NAD(P)H-binding protein [Luteimonas gilva]TKR33099.1 NmrA family transcriptional regulator [Luteimonas gilva]